MPLRVGSACPRLITEVWAPPAGGQRPRVSDASQAWMCEPNWPGRESWKGEKGRARSSPLYKKNRLVSYAGSLHAFSLGKLDGVTEGPIQSKTHRLTFPGRAEHPRGLTAKSISCSSSFWEGFSIFFLIRLKKQNHPSFIFRAATGAARSSAKS